MDFLNIRAAFVFPGILNVFFKLEFPPSLDPSFLCTQSLISPLSCSLYCLSTVSFRRLLCMSDGSGSILLPSSPHWMRLAGITGERRVCIDRSLTTARVLKKLDAEPSFAAASQVKET